MQKTPVVMARLVRLSFLITMGMMALVGTASAQGANNSNEDSVLDMPSLPQRALGNANAFFIPSGPEVDPTIEDGIRIVSVEPIKTLNSVGVAEGRTRIEYNEFVLEADRMKIDYVSGTITAIGNVIFRGPERVITADRGRFDMVRNEGIAYGVDGQSGEFFFRAIWDEAEKGPGFRQIDRNESVFRGVHFTTSNFPVPMYYIASTEVILIRNKRIYFRNPVLHIRNTPVFWLPIFSRSLDGGSPWSFFFGFGSDVGTYFRLGYRFIHQVKEPDWEDPELYRSISHGQLDLAVDYYTERGFGTGATYAYQFDEHRHIGYLSIYGIRDSGREVEQASRTGRFGEIPNSGADGAEDDERWAYYHKHNSLLSRYLTLQVEIDEVSDSEVYLNFLDLYQPASDFRRGRLFSQRSRVALTANNDTGILRAMVDRRERLSRDRFTDHADPFDDDLNFDPDPIFGDGDEFEDEGIPRDRFATVKESISGRAATRLIKLGSAPFYTRFEANAFNSLDPGFNRLNERDDSHVYGGDVYGSITNRIRLGERTTWMNTIGIGGAAYERGSDELIPDRDWDAAAPPPPSPPFQAFPGGPLIFPPPPPRFRTIDGLRALSQDTLLIGDSEVERSLAGRDPGYYFVDYRSRLSHRFTDWMEGYLEYFVREGNDDTLQEFYEQTGYLAEARNDIYDFYYNRHWLDARLNFFFRYPNIFMSLYAGQNLQSDDEIYANERANYAGFFVNYSNRSREFTASTGINYETRQIRDPEDPNEFRQGSYTPFINLFYYPNHARYWGQLTITSNIKSEEDPVERDRRQERRFDENRTEVLFSPVVGRQFGPKYRVQVGGTYTTRYDWWDNIGVTVLRDLHDAELGLFLGVNADAFEEVRDDRDLRKDSELEADYELEVRGSIRFKISRDQPGLGARSITTLSDLRREGRYVR